MLPFVIFCLGWLNLVAGIGFTLLSSWGAYLLLKTDSAEKSAVKLAQRTLFVVIIILGVWVLLSGIGGYAFQNIDHHWRNAMFRDLIERAWPVIYTPAEIATPEVNPQMLVYYLGFWLPAALGGKLLGWEVANALLFGWTWLGVALVGILLILQLKSKSIWPIWLLIFFSGMDILGVLIRQRIAPLPNFSNLWPPMQHLENWAYPIQFSANTTQLFWIFNQAIPCWLAILLILRERRGMVLIWAATMFLSPLAALGMVPYLILAITLEFREKAQKLISSGDLHPYRSGLKNIVQKYFTLANILGGGSIAVVTYFYFAQNALSADALAPFSLVRLVMFLLIEGLLIWLLLLPLYQHKPQWYLVGSMLIFSPLLLRGDFDYGMRVSLPTLFLLMLGVGYALDQKEYQLRPLLLVFILIGAVTAVFEIDRSIIRTTNYYLNAPTPLARWSAEKTSNYEISAGSASAKTDHPDSLVADYFKSLTAFKSEFIESYLGDTTSSVFYQYLAKR